MESKEIVNRSLHYIERHLEMQLTVEMVASAVGYSKFHFARMFKHIMGMTVMEYVGRRKLIKASEAILDGGKMIDVALQFGWQSHSGFTKAFKKEFGFTPSLLRAILFELESYGGNNMSHVFLNRTDEHATKEQLFAILKTKLEDNSIVADAEELQKVYDFACQSYAGVTRYSGDEYVTHPLNVAILLAEMNADAHVVLAGMLCDVTKKTDITFAELRKNIPQKVVDLLVRVVEFERKSTDAPDDEVIMLKLAERLHNMRTVGFMSRDEQKIKAKETVELFMPLARKLRNSKLLDELNDLSMKYL